MKRLIPEGSGHEMDMCNGPLYSKIALFTLPLMANNVLQFLFNTADTIIVGRFESSHALAAVGSCGIVCSLMINLFIGLSAGVNILAARFYE